MENHKKNIILFLITFFSFFWIGNAFAFLNKPSGGIAGMVSYFFDLSVAVGSLIAVVFIIGSGFTIMISKGNPSKVSEAKKRLFGALLGLFILTGTFAIISIINSEALKFNEVKPREPISDDGPNGVYLEDSNGKKIKLTVSTPNLFTNNFAGKSNIVNIQQPEKGAKYGAIFFSDVDYKGKCYFIGDATGSGSTPFAINSIYIFRTNGGGGSPVKVYNNDNGECAELPETKKAFYPEIEEVSSYGSPYKLVDKNEHWLESASIKISDDVLVLMETRDKEFCPKDEEEEDDEGEEDEKEKGKEEGEDGEEEEEEDEIPKCPNCQIIKKTSENETCYPLKYDFTYNPDSVISLKPGYITLFQLSK
ncbi:pilin [bacterium]|nr:pilin [bacterium]